MGSLYEKETDVKQDYQKALGWYNKAAKSDDHSGKEAKDHRDALLKKMKKV
ncbi:SEL1-like repeat protein [Aneurinibacillus uraniidurans]|nr:SEL1-like repeat protein [Aneurinibacillus sp. B1]WCN37582.1 SEL1-like repeat protein [Aneurinibacillus sp. B1]